MNTLFAALLILTSPLAQADIGSAQMLPAAAVCTVTPEAITTVLLNTGDSLLELKKANLYEAQSVSCEIIEQGVKTFELKFSTCGNCLPKRATLTVTQDLRPTFRDGAPI